MKFTNDNDLPPAIMVAAMSDDYDRGDADISVTELLAPARHRIMEQAYGDKVSMDVSMRVHAMMGTAMHKLMEHGDEPSDVVKEERLYAEANNWKISGQIDRVERDRSGFLLTDYKVTSTAAIQSLKPEWPQQLNLYRWLFHENHGAWPRARIVAFLRDWTKAKATVMGDKYPQAPVAVIEMPLWSPRAIREFLDRRLMEHQDAQRLYDATEEIVNCSPDERWATGERYRVVKLGAKRASAVFDTYDEARHYLVNKAVSQYRIETAPSEEKRCENYCVYAEHCQQWQDIWQTRDINEMLKEIE